MHHTNFPFTPWNPVENAEMFYNQKTIVETIHKVIKRPPNQKNSCALIGGPDMGKTSILKHLERDLLDKLKEPIGSPEPRFIPVYIALQVPDQNDREPLRTIYYKIVNTAKSVIASCLDRVVEWPDSIFEQDAFQTSSESRVRQEFVTYLSHLQKIVEQKIGNTKFVLLVDDVHKFAHNATLCTNLADSLLLLLNDQNKAFRTIASLVLTCIDDFKRLLRPTDRTNPLITVLERILLKPFHREDSIKLMQEPLNRCFSTCLNQELFELIYDETGGHPLLIHLFMQALCENHSDLQLVADAHIYAQSVAIITQISEVAEQIFQMISQVQNVGSIFEILRKSSLPLRYQEITHTPEVAHIGFQGYIDDALCMLEFLGVITMLGTGYERQYIVSGKIWRNYLARGGEWAVLPPTPGVPTLVVQKIFLIHGHDEAAKSVVARFLERLELRPIILQEEPDNGQTIPEKLEYYADVDFAIGLLTPDDQGALSTQSTQLRPRPRQNVIYELGYFMAKLGRHRVVALFKGNIEIPSDLHGILHIEMDTGGGWQVKLSKEMKASGIQLDLNKVISQNLDSSTSWHS